MPKYLIEREIPNAGALTPDEVQGVAATSCGVLRDMGRIDAARWHLGQAVALDPAYADAVYNLAALEYDAHDLAAARQWWLRYLELDGSSDWARRARAGVGLANRLLNKVG